jgi:hypothetical protein
MPIVAVDWNDVAGIALNHQIAGAGGSNESRDPARTGASEKQRLRSLARRRNIAPFLGKLLGETSELLPGIGPSGYYRGERVLSRL